MTHAYVFVNARTILDVLPINVTGEPHKKRQRKNKTRKRPRLRKEQNGREPKNQLAEPVKNVNIKGKDVVLICV